MRQLIVLMLVCFAARNTSAGRLPSDTGLPLQADAPTSALQPRTIDISSLASLISIVKEQFREIIEELVKQALSYIIDEVHIYKLNLLKKLGKYTLSDVFHTIFDGVTDFVSTETEGDDIATTAADVQETSEINEVNLGYLPYQWREMLVAQERRKAL